VFLEDFWSRGIRRDRDVDMNWRKVEKIILDVEEDI
jgi:hypothetical protein